MACDITSGFSLGCRDNLGGIKNIYILSGSVSSVAGSANGLITGISGSGIFYKFELTKGTGDFTETINSSIENGTVFYQQVVNAPFQKMQSSLRNQVKVLAQNPDLKLVVEANVGAEDGVGKWWYVGQENGMTLSGGTGQTGTAFGDANQYTLTFQGDEPFPASEVSGSTTSFLSALDGITIS